MLEIRNISKTYKIKNGVNVKALDNVSLKIEEKGMVFILGKSGSGKSTLLNVLGGLDTFDSGEIIVCGKSSKAFSSSDFDSYRNTYIGFIFQEYNVLDNFTVGANIGLALELQGKKATNEEITNILRQVDLEGLGKRKPNELSGGQKQRVAIARALIKNPEIIMADEPSGALDSKTGEQIFNTLKKLSKEKLVIIVSHDREFAKLYADRIIELSDGKIISDVKKELIEPVQSNGISYIDDKIIRIKKGYTLTAKDIEQINEYIKNNSDCDSFISLDESTNTQIKKAAHITEDGGREVFNETKEITLKQYSANAFKLIKSKLPLKKSFKIGASGLKIKKFRLFLTILLSTVAFVLFGLANTMASYNKTDTTLNSIKDSKIDYTAITRVNIIKDGDYDYTQETLLSDNDMKTLKERFPKLTFTPILSDFEIQYSDSALSFSANLGDTSKVGEGQGFTFYKSRFTGYASINADTMKKYGYTLNGELPGAEEEIAITDYCAEHFIKAGYKSADKTIQILSANEMIGKIISVYSSIENRTVGYKVTGIINTNFDSSRYDSFKSWDEQSKQGIVSYLMYNEMKTVIENSLHSVAFISSDSFSSMLKSVRGYSSNIPGAYITLTVDGVQDDGKFVYIEKIKSAEMIDTGKITFFDKTKTALGENEILISNAELVENGKNFTFERTHYNGSNSEQTHVKVVGTYGEVSDGNDDSYKSIIVVASDDVIKKLNLGDEEFYSTIVAEMPESDEEKLELINYCYNDGNDTLDYKLNNSVMVFFDDINEAIEELSSIFMYIGLGFAFFASLMLMNFIATSISHKKREIGILRALGARGSDVFGIFFNEALLIAAINWISSSVFTGIAVMYINHSFRDDYNLLITILNYGITQILLMLGISVAVAFIASFIPVFRTSRKKPIEAIRRA